MNTKLLLLDTPATAKFDPVVVERHLAGEPPAGRPTMAERAEIVRRAALMGWGNAKTSRITGLPQRTVQRIRQRQRGQVAA